MSSFARQQGPSQVGAATDRRAQIWSISAPKHIRSLCCVWSSPAPDLVWGFPSFPDTEETPALVSVPHLPSGMESSSNKDLLISVNSGDRMMDWEQPETKRKEIKGLNTLGLFLYKHLCPEIHPHTSDTCCVIFADQKQKAAWNGQGAALAHMPCLPQSSECSCLLGIGAPPA